MDRDYLNDQIVEEFGCSRVVAREISQKALQLKSEAAAESRNWDGPEIDSEYVVSRLKMAPRHLSPTARWNWWVGMMNAFGGSKQDYRID